MLLPRSEAGEFPALLAITTLTIYLCVPETDQMPMVSLVVVVLLVVELLLGRPAPAALHLVAAAMVLWSGLYGATGRASAIVGTLFAFWPLVLVAAATSGLWWWQPRPAARTQRWAIGFVGGIAALVVARTGAIQPSVGPALVAAVLAAVVSVLVAGLILGPLDRVGSRSDTRR